MNEVSLFQEQIFKKLRNGTPELSKQDFFSAVIEQACSEIASTKNSRVTLSPSRVIEAQELWENDLLALINDKKVEKSKMPCEFKHAAFLTYWLRRRVIVEGREPIDWEVGVVNALYNQYPNEYLALSIGLRLILYHHYVPAGADPIDTLAQLENIELPRDLLREAVVYLHHKNVSPHSVYLFFKSLLVNLPPPRLNTGIQSV